ncbi:hypothetical protein AB0M39_30665 [Streptomyces sp. NPDC051907]|uniref:hypothetical protein n=1 Tax=Streptomyces sp. NPDC051907 TaxID=3155284 RepID=UPI00341AC5FD
MSTDLPTAPASSSPTAEAARRLRMWSVVWAALLVPATIATGILALTAENAGRCIGYDESCGGNPEWAYGGSLLVAGVAWATVLCVPSIAVRRAALWIQLAAECVFLTAVLTTFA